MNLDKFNKIFKNKRNYEISKLTGLTQAMIGQLKSGKIYPSSTTMKIFYLASNGRFLPNDFFPIEDTWRQDLKTLKQQKKEIYEK